MHLSDVQDRFEVIKKFHLFLYSIETNLFKHVFGIKCEAEQKMSETEIELCLKY